MSSKAIQNNITLLHLQIFPRHVIEALSMGGLTIENIAAMAQGHENVTIIFAGEICSFTGVVQGADSCIANLLLTPRLLLTACLLTSLCLLTNAQISWASLR